MYISAGETHKTLATENIMKIKKAWLVEVNGKVTPLVEIVGKELSLKEMYKIIGCSTIEHVGLKKGVDMWVDEEGLLKSDFKVNVKATAMYQKAFNTTEVGIVGNAIITDNTKSGDFIK